MPTREIPLDVTQTVQTARILERSGRERIQEAADMIRDTAKRLKEQGWIQADIALALGVSGQRVSQLLNPPKEVTRK